MTAPQRGFEIAEFASRCAKAQLAMAAGDIGAMLLTSEHFDILIHLIH
mgnify:CR=1 FL=1